MSENNQMMSVEGQLVGMPLAGPESFSQQQLDYLKRALGVDETVLWSTTNGSSTGNLSEEATNFERLRVYWNYNDNGTTQAKTIIEIPIYSEVTRYFLNVTFGQSYCYLISVRVDFSNNFGTFTAQNASGVQVTKWGGEGAVASVATSNVNPCKNGIYKIVGIHRISGGNQ